MSHYCSAKCTDGSLCDKQIPETEKFCAYHRKKYQSSVRHGRNADPRVLGIPNNKVATFEAFQNDPEPLELLNELAYLRTLLVELRESLESNRHTRRARLESNLTESWNDWFAQWKLKPENHSKVMAFLNNTLRETLDIHLGPSMPFNPTEISQLTALIEAISRTAEKAKKIKDGYTTTIVYGAVSGILSKFMLECIFREVTDVGSRRRIAQAAQRIIPSQKMLTTSYEEAEYEVVGETA